MKQLIQTHQAPDAIGCYSQAIKTERTVFFSGQIPLDPISMIIVSGGIKPQVIRVFENIKAVCEASGGNLNDIVKLTVYLTDIQHATVVNEVMVEYFTQPYPARTTIAVVALPKEALVEIEAVMLTV
jgi:reactive intermediate/imine deaminase